MPAGRKHRKRGVRCKIVKVAAATANGHALTEAI
jgi:hypothetical protein